jgi:tyrosine-protein phosphatase SIW14
MEILEMEPPHQLLLVPPLNFAIVMPGIYRSGFFNSRNYTFLLRSLRIKTVLHLTDSDYTEHKIGQENLRFIEAHGLQFFTFPLQAHKEPFGKSDRTVVSDALRVLLDVRNHPVLCHDEKGKHRAGVLIGCLRKIQSWSLASIFHEYALFTRGSVRLLDMQWIEFFEEDVKVEAEFLPKWLQLEEA